MRADVSMDATQIHMCQERHQAENGCHASAPDTHPKDKVCPTIFSSNRMMKAKALVDKAVKTHKIFSIQGPYPVIRTALRARGWVEQHMQSSKHRRQNSEGTSSSNDADEDNSDTAEKEPDPDTLHNIMSRLVRNEMVYFYWTNRRDVINTNNLQKKQIVNHFPKAESFTTKVGLCMNLRNLHWFDSADPDTFFPRCYRLSALDERYAFIDDYRLTASTSLLKFIVERSQNIQGKKKSYTIQEAHGPRKKSKHQLKQLIIPQMINCALKICQEYLSCLEHRDIDKGVETLSQEQWAEFIHNYYHVVHGGAQIENSDSFVNSCKAMLQRLEKVCPQLGIDGTQNIWIIKPGSKSRGREIKCMKRLDQILRLVNNDSNIMADNKWIVQKYIEQPLLVHGTKFDVRQWFLVTDWNPLTVWFYKKCYLRFSTQPYSLDNLDSSVHLCNNAIQKHLRPSQLRDRSIPADNMWTDDQFRSFLNSQGQESLWVTVVIPGMKKAIIHALQTAQDIMDSRKNTFELYGADFMFGHDLHPWLIEINASPTMQPSTSVTARLCAAVQKDTLRVILDRRFDHTADTGDFELIYQQAPVDIPHYTGIDLLIEGVAIKKPCSVPPQRSFYSSASKRQNSIKEKKESLPEKVLHFPKMPLIKTETKNNSSKVLSSPLNPFKLNESKRVKTLTLQLPMNTNWTDGVEDRESHPLLLSKRHAEVSKYYYPQRKREGRCPWK